MKNILKFITKHLQKIIIAVLIIVLLLELWMLFKPSVSTVEASKITDWGLSFQGDDNTPPTAPISAENLAALGAYYIGDTTKNTIYLTFDAGYENGYAQEMLDVLNESGVQAAFFLTGHYFKTSPEIVKRMVNEGHTVGNHTMTHPDMSKITDIADFRVELEEVERLYYDVCGTPMKKIYRAPQGKFDLNNLKQAQLLGYKTVFWSLAYADWDNTAQPDPDASLEKLFSRIHPGAVVLLHLTSETNSKILKQFIDGCRERGYEFGDISSLFT